MHRSRGVLIFILVTMMAAACDDDSAVALASDPSFAAGGNSSEGFLTEWPALVSLSVPGTLTPLATASDILPGGAQLIGIPDGIGVYGGRFMNLYLNHELDIDDGFGGARVSRFVIDTHNTEIDFHAYVIDGTEGYSRLCSAEWVDSGDGFSGGYFFTGEEESSGVQLAIDHGGNVTELPWIGRYAHENQISVPGFPGSTVVLNFDDSGTSGADASTEDGSSEVYMYVATNSHGVLQGAGQLYVFASDDADNVGDLSPGDMIAGRWIPIPEAVALNPAGSVLEDFVDEPDSDAFDFTRVEDGFYDKTPEAGPAAYFFDTGDPTLGDGVPWDKWGSIYRLDWDDPSDPAGPTHLTLLARSSGPASGWASPDNGDMNPDGVIMLQEDPAADPWAGHEPSIFALERAADGSLIDPAGTLIATVDGSDCIGDNNCWETSGIVDASEWFGPGAWIFDVQAHDEPPPVACPGCVENGQLLLMQLD